MIFPFAALLFFISFNWNAWCIQLAFSGQEDISVCVTHTAHLTDLPFTLCTSWELPPVQLNKTIVKKDQRKKQNKTTTFHTHRSTCADLFPSLVLLDVPEEHGREKQTNTNEKKQKCWPETQLTCRCLSRFLIYTVVCFMCDELYVLTCSRDLKVRHMRKDLILKNKFLSTAVKMYTYTCAWLFDSLLTYISEDKAPSCGQQCLKISTLKHDFSCIFVCW